MAAARPAWRDDPSLFALALLPGLGLTLVAAKWLAVRHAFPSAPARVTAAVLVRVCALDLLLLAGLCFLVLAGRGLGVPRRGRTAVVVVLAALATAIGVFHVVDAGFFTYFGAPLTVDLLHMAPAMARYAGNVIDFGSSGFLAFLAALALPLAAAAALHRPLGALVRGPRSWRAGAWGAAAALAAAGAVALAAGVAGYREKTLRDIALLAFFLPAAPRTPPAPTPRHAEALREALGPPRADAAAAFAALPRRPRNVVFFVLESIGERFLRAHHPLGQAETPNLARLEALGSVRFAEAYTECPLSAQADWALNSGMSPPANPFIFRTELPLPRTPVKLPGLLRREGYRTIFISSSYLESWGEARFLPDAGFESVEDINTMPGRERFRTRRWSLEGRAVVERFLEWAGEGRPPFYAVLWNVETHHDYEWIGMPERLRAAGDLPRYLAAIEQSDRLLGTLHAEMERRGLGDDTLLVVVGDHGQGLGRGERSYDRMHSLLPSEEALHVPLVFLHPSLPRGGAVVRDLPVALTDVYPTVADLAGVAPPEGLDGRSLARPYEPRVLVLRSIGWWPLAARAGRFKLVQYRPDDVPELFDTRADPWETRDVSLEFPDVAAALWASAALETERRRREDPSFSLFNPWAGAAR